MKLLRVTAQGLPLFKEKLDLSFYAQQRVAEEDKVNLYSLFSKYIFKSGKRVYRNQCLRKDLCIKGASSCVGNYKQRTNQSHEYERYIKEIQKMLF